MTEQFGNTTIHSRTHWISRTGSQNNKRESELGNAVTRTLTFHSNQSLCSCQVQHGLPHPTKLTTFFPSQLIPSSGAEGGACILATAVVPAAPPPGTYLPALSAVGARRLTNFPETLLGKCTELLYPTHHCC